MADELPIAVLLSGGLDSGILLGEMLGRHPAVHPLFIRGGLRWEAVELAHVQRFLVALQSPTLRPLQVLEEPVGDLYGQHWSITGRDVPDAATPDDAVFLPGRNVLLLAKSILWCQRMGVPRLALGLLAANPFPDATPEFIRAFQAAVNQAVGGSVEVVCPYAKLSKMEVLQRGGALPLELTFSCIAPVDGKHCGRCNKCAERQQAFRQAEMVDRTDYAA